MGAISEGSYNILFIVGVVVAVLFVLSSAYFFDRFHRASENNLTMEETLIAKHVSMVTLIVGILCFALLFVLYFGFRREEGHHTHHVVHHDTPESFHSAKSIPMRTFHQNNMNGSPSPSFYTPPTKSRNIMNETPSPTFYTPE